MLGTVAIKWQCDLLSTVVHFLLAIQVKFILFEKENWEYIFENRVQEKDKKWRPKIGYSERERQQGRGEQRDEVEERKTQCARVHAKDTWGLDPSTHTHTPKWTYKPSTASRAMLQLVFFIRNWNMPSKNHLNAGTIAILRCWLAFRFLSKIDMLELPSYFKHSTRLVLLNQNGDG